MTPLMNIIFFGSTTDSVIVAKKLFDLRLPADKAGFTICDLRFSAVVTQPPKPAGRKQILTPTPVDNWAKSHAIPVLSFPSDPQKPWLYTNEETVADTLAPFKTDLLISASFGQKIPDRTIHEASYRGINVHPSILPRWRGADPVPWAILSGDNQIGVTIVTLNERFDEGKIIALKKIPITDKDTSDPLRTKLFTIGADLLVNVLPAYLASKPAHADRGEVFKGSPKTELASSYARKFTRDDGFEQWENFSDPKEAGRIYRKFRALSPWPGLWSLVNEKRVKILACHVSHDSILVLDTVQLEGKKPVSWKQFEESYLH
jgi:methionyl-tRNA formyltransferase